MSETQHLAEQQQALMVELQRLAAEVQTLRAAAAAGGPAPEQKEKDKAKLGTPKPFNGHVGTNVLTWVIGMEAYLVGCNTPPNRWPLVASSYLEDSAKEWFHSYFVSTNGVMTWDTFKAGLLARFRPVDSNRIGRAQLMELKMKPNDRGRGILQYVNRFLQLVNQVSDITENEKFTYFNQGLTPELQRLLIPLTHINNVNDAISMVVKFEMLTQQPSNAEDRRTFRNSAPWRNPTPWTERRSGNGQGNGLPTVGSPAARPVPMELGAMDQDGGAETDAGETEAANVMRSGGTGTRIKRLTQQELEQHLRQGLCFRCHKEGHQSRQCPLNRSARS
jgi:Retrotransposon gag protein